MSEVVPPRWGRWPGQRRGGRRRSLSPFAHDISQSSDSFNLQFDDVAGFQPTAHHFGCQFEDTSGADGTGTEDVAWAKFSVATGMGEELRPGPVHTRCIAARVFFAIYRCAHGHV